MKPLYDDRYRPGFMEGAGIALLTSVVTSMLVTSFGWMIPYGFTIYLLSIAVGLGYLLYLLSRSRYRTGRITVVALYIAMMSVLVGTGFPPRWILLSVFGAVWLVRSLYFYNSLLSALLDLGLTAFSIAAAIATYLHTESLFLSVWSLMLVQACFVWIPADWQQHARGKAGHHPSGRFDAALRAAENAARKLATQSSN